MHLSLSKKWMNSHFLLFIVYAIMEWDFKICMQIKWYQSMFTPDTWSNFCTNIDWIMCIVLFYFSKLFRYHMQVCHQPNFLEKHHNSSSYNAHGPFFNKSDTMFIYNSRYLSGVALAPCPTQSQCFSIYSLGRSGARLSYMPRPVYIVATTSGSDLFVDVPYHPNLCRHQLEHHQILSSSFKLYLSPWNLLIFVQ